MVQGRSPCLSTGRLIPAFHLPWITTTKKKTEHKKDKHLPQKGLQEIKFVGYLPDQKYYEEFRLRFNVYHTEQRRKLCILLMKIIRNGEPIPSIYFHREWSDGSYSLRKTKYSIPLSIKKFQSQLKITFTYVYRFIYLYTFGLWKTKWNWFSPMMLHKILLYCLGQITGGERGVYEKLSSADRIDIFCYSTEPHRESDFNSTYVIPLKTLEGIQTMG